MGEDEETYVPVFNQTNKNSNFFIKTSSRQMKLFFSYETSQTSRPKSTVEVFR